MQQADADTRRAARQAYAIARSKHLHDCRVNIVSAFLARVNSAKQVEQGRHTHERVK